MTTRSKASGDAFSTPGHAGRDVEGRSTWRQPLVVLMLVVAVHIGAGLVLLAASPEPQRVDRAMPVRVIAAELIARGPQAPAHAESAPPRAAQPRTRVATPRVPLRHAGAAPVNHALPPTPPAASPPAVSEPTSIPARSDNTSVPANAGPAEDVAASASRKRVAPGGAAASSVPKSVTHLECAIARPAYPALSRRMRETGTVLVELVVGEAGRVESARIAATSGYERLDEAAREAVLASTCSPYLENGIAYRVTAKVPITFNLND